MLNNRHTTRIITFFLLSAKPIFFRCAYASKGKMRGKNMENVLGLKLSLVQLQSRSVSTSTFSTRILIFFCISVVREKEKASKKKRCFYCFVSCFIHFVIEIRKKIVQIYTRGVPHPSNDMKGSCGLLLSFTISNLK